MGPGGTPCGWGLIMRRFQAILRMPLPLALLRNLHDGCFITFVPLDIKQIEVVKHQIRNRNPSSCTSLSTAVVFQNKNICYRPGTQLSAIPAPTLAFWIPLALMAKHILFQVPGIPKLTARSNARIRRFIHIPQNTSEPPPPHPSSRIPESTRHTISYLRHSLLQRNLTLHPITSLPKSSAPFCPHAADQEKNLPTHTAHRFVHPARSQLIVARKTFPRCAHSHMFHPSHASPHWPIREDRGVSSALGSSGYPTYLLYTNTGSKFRKAFAALTVVSFTFLLTSPWTSSSDLEISNPTFSPCLYASLINLILPPSHLLILVDFYSRTLMPTLPGQDQCE